MPSDGERCVHSLQLLPHLLILSASWFFVEVWGLGESHETELMYILNAMPFTLSAVMYLSAAHISSRHAFLKVPWGCLVLNHVKSSVITPLSPFGLMLTVWLTNQPAPPHRPSPRRKMIKDNWYFLPLMEGKPAYGQRNVFSRKIQR